MANKQEYSKFTVTSIRDTESGGYGVSSYDRDIKKIVNTVKSYLPKDAFIKVGDKDVSSRGKLTLDIYTHKEDSGSARKGFSEVTKSLVYKGSDEEKYKATSKREISDTELRSLIKADRSKAEESEKRSREQTTSHITRNFVKVTAVLTILADLARRILSSVISMATETAQTARTARNMNTSFSTLREAEYLETVHNIPKGTISGAMADIRSKFGNITSLDQGALEALAVVMGSDVKSLILSGMGGDKPDELLGLIIDSFNKRANTGYNSVGKYVGEDAARNELYGYLLKISPQIAELFATMQDERTNINSIYRNQYETFEEWKKLFPTMRGGFNSVDYGMAESLSELTGVVKTLYKQVLTGLELKLTPTVTALLKKIANSRIFMTETERKAFNEENKTKNLNYIKYLDSLLEAFPEEAPGVDTSKPSISNEQRARAAYRETLLELRGQAVEANVGEGGDIDDVSLTPLQIQGKVTEKMQESVSTLLNSDDPYRFAKYSKMLEIAQTYAPDRFGKEKLRLTRMRQDELEKERLAEKEKEWNAAWKDATKRFSTYGDIHNYLATTYPDLFAYTVDKNGNKAIDYRYKYITDDERLDLYNKALESVKEEEIVAAVFGSAAVPGTVDSSSKWYSLFKGRTLWSIYADLIMEELKDIITKSPEFLAGYLPTEEKMSSLLAGDKLNEESYSVVAGRVDNTYKLVLDLKSDGFTEDDIVLFSATGLDDAFTGETGITYDTKTKKFSLNNARALPASMSAGMK